MAIKIIDINLNGSDLAKEHAELNSLLQDGWTLIGNSSYVHEYRYGETNEFSDNTPFERYTLFKPDTAVAPQIVELQEQLADAKNTIAPHTPGTAYITFAMEALNGDNNDPTRGVIASQEHNLKAAQERIAALEMAISKAQAQLDYAEEGYDRHPSHVMVHIKNAQRHLNDALNEDTE